MRQKRVLAVSSGGGHWVEMRRLLPAFEGFEVVYASTEPMADADLAAHRYYPIKNVSRSNALAVIVTAWQILRVLRRERPQVVITTGAAPGLLALALAKALTGSRTVWIDSIAAAEQMSLSGRLARRFADAWLTQWVHLARPGGPDYWGAVL